MKPDYAVRTQSAESFKTFDDAKRVASKIAHQRPGQFVGIYERVAEAYAPISPVLILHKPGKNPDPKSGRKKVAKRKRRSKVR